MKDNPNIERTPFGLNAIVPSSEQLQPGVIFILKNRNNGINIGKQNLLHPFYMLYLSNDGEVICNHLSPKELLDLMRQACKGQTQPIKALCDRFNEETEDGRDMRQYSDLLQKAIHSIIDVKEEVDIIRLFSIGETTALTDDILGLDDFELICFLVVREQ